MNIIIVITIISFLLGSYVTLFKTTSLLQAIVMLRGRTAQQQALGQGLWQYGIWLQKHSNIPFQAGNQGPKKRILFHGPWPIATWASLGRTNLQNFEKPLADVQWIGRIEEVQSSKQASQVQLQVSLLDQNRRVMYIKSYDSTRDLGIKK